MVATAAVAALGGVIAWFTIRADVLDAEPSSDDAGTPARAATDRSCAVAGTSLRPSREADCRPATVTVSRAEAKAEA